MDFTALLLLPLLASGPPARVELTVSAAASLKDALAEVATAYQAHDKSTTLTFNLGGSGALQHQVEQGAPVDVVVLAAAWPMDALEQKGLLLPGTRSVVARNQLVLVVPKGATAVRGLPDLAKPEVQRIALGEPGSVPAGRFAQEALQHQGLWEAVRTRTVLAKDVRQVLAYVQGGHVDAGVVYATDAQASSQVDVVQRIPPAWHGPLVVPAAVVRDSAHPAQARRFCAFLASPEAQRILARHGFLPAAE